MTETETRPEGVSCANCGQEIRPEHLMAAVVDTEGGETLYFHGISQIVHRSWECEQKAEVLGFFNNRKRLEFFAPSAEMPLGQVGTESE